MIFNSTVYFNILAFLANADIFVFLKITRECIEYFLDFPLKTAFFQNLKSNISTVSENSS